MAKEVSTYISKAPYNFIELDKFVLDRCTDENEIINHDKFYDNLNTGYIEYEIEVITPLHVSSGKNSDREKAADSEDISDKERQFFKDPQGRYAIPGNTIRGMTRFNASIFSFASVINEEIKKHDIANQRFYYRTFASSDKNMREWYKDKTGLRVITENGFTHTALEKVQAGYIRKHGDGYIIIPAVKMGSKSYTPIHEFDLRNRDIKGINYLYQPGLKKEDYKNKEELKNKRNFDYRPYIAKIKYNTDGNRAIIDENGKFTGYLVNSNYIDGKVHHYLIFEEDRSSQEINVTREQAELYKDDMEYTQKQNANSDRAIKRYEYYELPKGDEVKPVFYIKENDTLFFGFTPYLRLPADGGIYDGIPETHRNYSGRDFVDSIFGWQNFRTKVSFTDALCESQNVSVYKYQMVLGQPKPSWYKGYIKQGKKDSLESYCSANFEIRGRKFYWMKNSADNEAMKLSLPPADKHDKISTIIYCCKEGTKFAGKVRFENLSDEELGLLIYSLKQGDTEGYFNIGMGKPYGLGKCKIKINRLITYDIKSRYMSFRSDSDKIEDINKYISAFKNYIKDHYNAKINDVNEIKSYKDYSLSKRVVNNEDIRYMKVNEFTRKSELPTVEEVAEGKILSGKLEKVKRTGENLAQNANENVSSKNLNRFDKSKGKNKYSSYYNNRNVDLNTNAFDTLKNFKFDNSKDK